MKKYLFIAIILVIGGVGASYAFSNKASEEPTKLTDEQIQEQQEEVLPSDTEEGDIAGETEKIFTMADVAAAGTKEKCYTTVNGNVYDLTSFLASHPGGEEAIEKICGKDGTALFTAQHGGSATQENKIATLKIGTLKKE